mgnify:CR=1 FL=1
MIFQRAIWIGCVQSFLVWRHERDVGDVVNRLTKKHRTATNEGHDDTARVIACRARLVDELRFIVVVYTEEESIIVHLLILAAQSLVEIPITSSATRRNSLRRPKEVRTPFFEHGDPDTRSPDRCM